MYDFILRCWTIGLLNENQVYSYVPTFITEEECAEILATEKIIKESVVYNK